MLISLGKYSQGIPRKSRIVRLSDLTPEEFSQNYTDIPFILTDVVPKWPVYRDWSETALLTKYGDKVFRAEAVDWPLKTYNDYMNNSSDESPLYLFDRDFVGKMELQVGHDGAYWPPDCFGEDLFMLLGKQRPDHRWLIVGPKRSGSTFHKDPNATSAWNAVIKGSKYWIMFPPSVLPPGVYMSADQSEVTSPLSIAEWLLTFHDEARNTPGCIEGVCHEGEVLHVPSGWWHLVVNLEPATAITQNFIPRAHLKSALRFLKDKSDQISGFSNDVVDPYVLFTERLRERHPELMDSLDSSTIKKRKWEEVVHNDSKDDPETGGFSFGFGGDDDLEDDTL
ncbi:putative f-box and domain [Phaeomoniella chlamydospora]|uniref:Putative f-box and domain n=1 Tax=Phaeomoniella chlamydospora TaxID=158046 RepID=A0A0G2E8L7_PHACM|nr:putative f-box and domain [Phaeomoniella chlamydospora]